ncbi:MAG: hypothetical protein Q7T55_03470, partial [Solirubrobacteraceae bacterium]|nr:hypothetical protein [Solirubrobacteraceae bacterium]
MLDPERPGGDPGGPDRPADGLPEDVARFVQDVEGALDVPQAARRLSLAGVRAQIDVTDAGLSVTLLLDRFPPAVRIGRAQDRPTVRLQIDAAGLDTMLAEGSHLPLAILSGDVVFEGSARKQLRVIPILRAAASEAR